ncbi:MAG: hypothetical protein AUJ92_03655 [Armatimonadetes bacterium CG2_30_59_28]|nr:MAG: hypothetical protein AUJ92_03655 [Armatimonadetes bacterium CG2_30_59_28]PIU62633.1 MAG: hypothetical protein COS85_17935 [Armatimonadetes bacterium CG07_land_8_20_14_0_80_59_28]PIX39355.1 MAG: hypothetical protein COZ56_17860 [Armatimonadetes bacterium CG_4_8_14_3_um_filter_58_9]PIY42402.1 MAG: hypothetical protein COZ05_13990 [Armatimonadetes bacterium CG_4_10_14_3_um_filter_59_10]PJB67214.1 MAG: hypothetical protein CO095_12340 [Armatimonadetes bacterium CG_4_9_14_3_um_filter_58_7]
MTAMHLKFREFACPKALSRLVQPLALLRLAQNAEHYHFDKNARKIFFKPFLRSWVLFFSNSQSSPRPEFAVYGIIIP